MKLPLLATVAALFSGTSAAEIRVSGFTPSPPKRDRHAEPLDSDRLLWAIEQAENTPHDRIGRHGERSSYQITAAVWAEHSTFPFRDASSNRLVCRAEARRVALRHLESIRVRLALWEIPDKPVWVALCWNGGINALLRNAATPATHDYARRVSNLYYDAP